MLYTFVICSIQLAFVYFSSISSTLVVYIYLIFYLVAFAHCLHFLFLWFFFVFFAVSILSISMQGLLECLFRATFVYVHLICEKHSFLGEKCGAYHQLKKKRSSFSSKVKAHKCTVGMCKSYCNALTYYPSFFRVQGDHVTWRCKTCFLSLTWHIVRGQTM